MYSPPGAGTELVSGDLALAGGTTISYTGIDLGQTDNLYFGVRNDLFTNGYSMDGLGIAVGEVFTYDSRTVNSITYVANSTFDTDFPNDGIHATPTRITWTFTGTGTLIDDATTVALNGAGGDVQALWHVESDFSANVLVEAVVPAFDGNAGNWEPGNDLVNRIPSSPVTGGTASEYSADWGFYYQLPEPGRALMLMAGIPLLLLLRRYRVRS